jgi:hypothetical protein
MGRPKGSKNKPKAITISPTIKPIAFDKPHLNTLSERLKIIRLRQMILDELNKNNPSFFHLIPDYKKQRIENMIDTILTKNYEAGGMH